MLLCIDDDVIILELLKVILEDSGYSVIAASSGSQGLRVLADYVIDLVILDWEMPQMNGRKTALEIKRMKPEMPIIINSGSSIPEDTFEIADAFVPKGIELESLLAVISNLIGRESHKGPIPWKKKEARREYYS